MVLRFCAVFLAHPAPPNWHSNCGKNAICRGRLKLRTWSASGRASIIGCAPEPRTDKYFSFGKVETPMPVLEAQQVKKDYCPSGRVCVHALRGVDVRVEAGEFLA